MENYDIMAFMVEIKDIEKLAELSRIALTEAEKEAMRTEIDSILGFVAQIQTVSGLPKTPAERAASKEEVRNVLREDTGANISGGYTESILANVPKRDGQYLKVKKIL